MLIVPLQAIPNQTVRVQLNNQVCQVNAYQAARGLFLDLFKDNAITVSGVICQNRNRIVRDAHLGFVGDLLWIDTQGSADPEYSAIGSRFFLAYLTPEELFSP